MKDRAVEIPATLTQAQEKSGYHFIILEPSITQSSYRIIPYSELYSGRNSIMETPAEYLQRAAEDEKLRVSKRKTVYK